MKEYMSLTEVGHIYGVTSHKIGKWLKGLGLRTANGQPSERARGEGYVVQSPSRQPGTFFYVWNVAKTTRLLDLMCYARAKSSGDRISSDIVAAYSVRQSGFLGQEIVNSDGLVVAWTVDRVVAEQFARIMNECDQQSV